MNSQFYYQDTAKRGVSSSFQVSLYGSFSGRPVLYKTHFSSQKTQDLGTSLYFLGIFAEMAGMFQL